MEENKGDDDDDDEDNKYVIDTSDEEENDLPFACFICRKPFVNPVKTKYARLSSFFIQLVVVITFVRIAL